MFLVFHWYLFIIDWSKWEFFPIRYCPLEKMKWFWKILFKAGTHPKMDYDANTNCSSALLSAILKNIYEKVKNYIKGETTKI